MVERKEGQNLEELGRKWCRYNALQDMEDRGKLTPDEDAEKCRLARELARGHQEFNSQVPPENRAGPMPIEGGAIYPNGGGGSRGGQLKPGEVRALAPNESFETLIHPESAQPEEQRGLSIGRIVRGLAIGQWDGAEPERRAMNTMVDSLGGAALPNALSARIVDLSRNKTRLIQAGAMTVPMETQELITAKVVGDPTAYWRGENSLITDSQMELGKVTLRAKTVAALVKMSVELVEDGQGVDSQVEMAISAALSQEFDSAGLYGLGAANQPLGIRNVIGVQTVSMGENGDTLDDYTKPLEARRKLLEVNAEEGRFAAIYSPRTDEAFEGLVESTSGQPLKAPPGWERVRKFITNQVSNAQTQGSSEAASDIFMGDFSQVMFGVRGNIRVEASREAGNSGGSAFSSLQVWIRAYARVDWAVIKPDHLCIIKGITA